MIYSLVSTRQTVAKVFRDLRIRSVNYNDDLIEWFAEALGLIGGTPQETLHERAVAVVNHVLPLPSPMTTLLGVLYTASQTTRGALETEAEFQTRVLDAPGQSVERSAGLQNPQHNGTQYPSYTLSAGYLYTSIENGVFVILYRGPSLDRDGYPLIPDHPSYAQALYWYAVMKMMEGGYRHPVVSYTQAEERWLKYCSQARAAGAFPDHDMMERIRDIWVQVIPDRTMFDNLFEREDHRSNRYEGYWGKPADNSIPPIPPVPPPVPLPPGPLPGQLIAAGFPFFAAGRPFIVRRNSFDPFPTSDG